MKELLYKIRDIALYFDGLNNKEKNLIKHWLRNTVEKDIVDDLEEILTVNKSEVDTMTSNVAKCIDEFYNDALNQGMQKGIQQGIQQGMQQGILNNKIENAKNLLDILDDETISLKLELEIEIVKKLRLEGMN